MTNPLRVAYTLEQCWHRVPGGTTTATLEVATRLADHADVELVGVAGRHRRQPDSSFMPPVPVVQLALSRPWLYEAWNRIGWPRVESATGPIDVCHSTTVIAAATNSPHVVTVHDTEFIDSPDRLTPRGVRVMQRAFERCRSADLVLCPSQSTFDRLVAHGFAPAGVRIVPWGVEARPVTQTDRDRVRRRYALPAEFVLFVGTIEPRKNLAALASAVSLIDMPLVVAGASGWGDVGSAPGEVHFLGFLGRDDLSALYSAATVFAYPSLAEGFGLPVAEAMAQGAPVVTSAGTSTEEVAGGAAVLVEPTDVESISAGLCAALADAESLSAAGLARAAELTWDRTVEATVSAYREIAR